MKLIQIPPDVIGQAWPLIAPLLETAVAQSEGIFTLEGVARDVAEHRKQLWVVLDDENQNRAMAAGVTSLVTYEGGVKTAFIELLGGENMKQWFSLKPEIEAWAKSEGCAELNMWARKGWAKHLPDYRIARYLMRKELA